MLKIIKKFLYIILAFCSCCVTTSAFALLPKEARVPGGIAIIDLQIPAHDKTKLPTVYYLGHRTLVLPDPNANNWLTVVGIPLEAKLGLNKIDIIYNDQKTSQTFEVNPKKYPKEHITVTNPRKVNPLPEDKIIIEKQYLEIINTYATWNYGEVTSIQLALPVLGRKSSPF